MKYQILNVFLSCSLTCACAISSGEAENIFTNMNSIYDLNEAAICYDVPLDMELQEHIDSLCRSRGIDTVLVLAVIEQESNYNCTALGDHERSCGLMQIQKRWHQNRMDRLGVTDLLDPYQNTEVGVDILSDLLQKNKGVEWALMAYNGGEALADRNMSMGVINDYAKSVMTFKENIKMTGI